MPSHPPYLHLLLRTWARLSANWTPNSWLIPICSRKRNWLLLWLRSQCKNEEKGC
ncbi:hypothetical protein HU200_046913 [Digitaria exilis]|uniref:Uncharacterized protein n=1 Tax=Digitaria exilis TaxID=1010633 RepID=A0A835B3E7_9POAL|nr:hypothetical protein HU200_046913 [Digitaria exilis]